MRRRSSLKNPKTTCVASVATFRLRGGMRKGLRRLRQQQSNRTGFPILPLRSSLLLVRPGSPCLLICCNLLILRRLILRSYLFLLARSRIILLFRIRPLLFPLLPLPMLILLMRLDQLQLLLPVLNLPQLLLALRLSILLMAERKPRRRSGI